MPLSELAVRRRLFDAATPHEVPGWDELASGRSFYVSADWLRFADTDGVARSRYLGLAAADGGRLVAALSSHWAPGEADADYVAARALGLPQVDDGVLTLGGRRGFLSGTLVAPTADHSTTAGHLAELIRHATETANTPGGTDAANTPSGTDKAHTRGGTDPAHTSGTAWWWPYLTSSDADLVLAAGRRLGSPGVHLVGADCVIDVAGTSIDDHVAALPTRQRRTNFRREAKRFRDSGLEIRRVDLAECRTDLGRLLAAVQRKYGHPQSADEMRARLSRQGEHLAARAVVFGCFAGDVMVGAALAYRWGDELVLRAVGFDYERLPGADEYAQLAVHAPLRYCYERGVRRLHLGTASYEAKYRRGARPRPLWAVTSLPGPDPGSHARTVRRIAASMPAHEAGSFTAQAERPPWR